MRFCNLRNSERLVGSVVHLSELLYAMIHLTSCKTEFSTLPFKCVD
jgi:hypothetical protein